MTTEAPEWIDYAKVRWNSDWCKRCHICVEACPRQALVLKDDAIVQVDGCDQTGLCQRLCPDLAIELIEPRTKGGQL
ncbi:MAG: 4Fe-4S binding protein [Dehalococcoidia bacterium]|nr:4Fe-4S binding protein [Dehalococcoidia bacterium]